MTNKPVSKLSPLASILMREDSVLNEVLAHAKQIQLLQDKLNQYLDKPMMEHIKIANYQRCSLTLVTHSSVIATRIRMQVPELLALFASDKSLANVKSVRVRVIPDETPAIHSKAPARPTRMSTETADLMKSIAASMDDRDIADCLMRISKHGKL